MRGVISMSVRVEIAGMREGRRTARFNSYVALCRGIPLK